MSAPGMVFVDYDGTITDQDTFYVLARELAGHEFWQQLEDRLQAGAITLREVLSVQARFLQISLDEADALLARQLHFDATFSPFVDACAENGAALAILSSGVGPLIARALARHGLSRVPILASEVTIEPAGWVLHHRDASANGHDKESAVRAAQAAGQHVVYIGDGLTDYLAAAAADVRFAKRGRALERFLRDRQLQFTAFDNFAQVQTALFGHKDR